MTEDVVDAVATDLNHFAVDLWPKAAADEGNVVLSPLSIAVALSMVHAGAKGETADEIARALHLDENTPEVHGALAAMLARWNEPHDDLELSVVDRLFGERTIAFHKDYLALGDAVFGASLEPVDFRTDASAARERINAWVEAQTKDRIENLLPSGAVGTSTRLVLVNAIYFKAPWAAPFNEYQTKDRPFHTPSGTRDVPMMRRTDRIRHAAHRSDALSVVELPYKGGRYAMVILLPADDDGLPALERKLDAAHLAKWTNGFDMTRVSLMMPKFEIEMPAPLTLSPILKSLGIEKAFNAASADFTGMAPAAAQLEVSEGFHKAFIAVDEKGTEAAAATAIGMRTTSAPPPGEPTPFHADHPFLYLIRDTGTGAILFMGRVTDPKHE